MQVFVCLIYFEPKSDDLCKLEKMLQIDATYIGKIFHVQNIFDGWLGYAHLGRDW
jgi:hypothetical protein